MRDLQAEWMAAMRRGDFEAAWAVNDMVLAARDPAARDNPGLPYHLRWVWDGRPFIGRHVLVRCYHGLGDTLQFARYLPVLRPQVASLTLEVHPSLLPLLARLPGPDRLVPFILDAPLKSAECDLEIMELPHALRLTPEEVPSVDLGISTDARSGAGVCWTSGGWDTTRDVPAALIAHLTRDAVALQPGPTTLPVVNPNGCSGSIIDTARLIAGLSLVITVDTMVAHLAGTLGIPTWLLLKHDADWRWMQGRSDCLWYPSMRLFRQPAPNDWRSVVEQVTGAFLIREPSSSLRALSPPLPEPQSG